MSLVSICIITIFNLLYLGYKKIAEYTWTKAWLIGCKYTMIRNLGLTKVFWVALAFSYFFLLLAMYAISTLPKSVFDADNAEHVITAVRLTYVRLSIVAISLVGYPIILFSSLKYTKYVTIALTAWAIAIYVDDHLVLYRITEYPERGVVLFIQSIRPMFLACLLWMSFELTFTKSEAR